MTCTPSNARRCREAEKNYPNGWARKFAALSHVESITMKLLYSYLRSYWPLVALALVLAAVNQVFSLLDPWILQHVIDRYATKFQEYSTGEFFRGVTLLLGAAVGVAFISRLAKNFQDYYINLITQQLGARLYSDGIRHSLQLPY